MAVCTEFVNGYLMQSSVSVANCTNYILVTADEYNSFANVFALDSSTITLCITFGFGMVVSTYFLAYPIMMAQKIIKLIGK